MTAVPADPLLLRGCHVVDVEAGEVRENSTVVVVDGRIADVVPAEQARAIGREYDLAGAFVLPGLVNAHVHLGLVPDYAAFSGESTAALALRMAANARRTVLSGVTTVRLVGEPGHADLDLRRAIDAEQVAGPRVYTAGTALCCTGGHGHDSGLVEADGADAFRRAARRQLGAGADLVKICISGGILGQHESIDDAQLTADEMRAVTDVAHAWGRSVAAHAGPASAIRTAVECGVDSVEHGYFLDRATAELMAERGTWLVPTIGVTRCRSLYERIGAPEWLVDKALAAAARHWTALQEAIRADVAVMMGTDMLSSEPFDGTTGAVRELELYVEAGMSPARALRTATVQPARFFGAEDVFGAVRAGLAADLVATTTNPLDDISALRGLWFVMRAGAIVRDDRTKEAGSSPWPK